MDTHLKRKPTSSARKPRRLTTAGLEGTYIKVGQRTVNLTLKRGKFQWNENPWCGSYRATRPDEFTCMVRVVWKLFDCSSEEEYRITRRRGTYTFEELPSGWKTQFKREDGRLFLADSLANIRQKPEAHSVVLDRKRQATWRQIPDSLANVVRHNMKTTLCIVLTLSLAHSVLCAAEDPLGAPDMKQFAKGAVERGWKYFKQGDYETALRRFEMATRHDKTFAPGYYGMAYVYSVQGKLDNAIKYYRESLKYDQTYPFTFANLGYALLQKEQSDEGLKMLDKALQLDPKCGEAHLSYANYYAQKKDWKKAEESANKAIECGQRLHPEFSKLLEKSGVKLKAGPVPPANGSQPIRSETNSTPPATASRR